MGSCEAMMVKLLLNLVSQERISVKEGGEAKEELSKVINDLAIVEEAKFLNFNKFTNGLDTFYAKLSIVEYSALWKMFVIIFCVFHGQSAIELFNVNADMVANNQSDDSLMVLHMVHDHMPSYEVGPHDMKLNKELLQSVGNSRRSVCRKVKTTVQRIFRRTKEAQKANRKRFKKKNCRRRN